MELSDARVKRTEIVYGLENIIRRTLQRLSSTKNKIDVCISSAAPDGTVKTDAVFNATVQLKEKGIKIKYITCTAPLEPTPAKCSTGFPPPSATQLVRGVVILILGSEIIATSQGRTI